MNTSRIQLKRTYFESAPHQFAEHHGCSVELFRYENGIEGVRLRNRRGFLTVLPYYGQMIWRAEFDGVPLTMENRFTVPQPAADIVGTYGCFMYHSGLLSNGNPGPSDTHALHGEMPLARIDQAAIELGEDDGGAWLAIRGEREYVMGFGDHYAATSRVVIRPDSATFDVALEVENRGLDPMDLMYMCHANFSYVEGGELIQPTGFDRDNTVIRTSVPTIVKSDAGYLERLRSIGSDPSVTARLRESIGLDPELVFYLKNLKVAADGMVHVMLRRPEGDAFSVAYDPQHFSHLVRWILVNNKQKVCALAMPATCGVEGYNQEKANGNVRQLAPGEHANFTVRLGYLNKLEANSEHSCIQGSVKSY